MKVQTQIIEQSWEPLDIQKYNEASQFDSFKKSLMDLRLQRVNIIQELSGMTATLNTLIQSRDNLIGMFQSEAKKMYPDLMGMDIGKVLPQLAIGHPLLSLWDIYAEKISNANAEILTQLQKMTDKNAADNTLAAKEAEVLKSYSSFKSSAAGAWPTTAELLATLQHIEVIPYVEESSTIVSLPMIDRINSNAAAIIALETADKTSEDPGRVEPEDEQSVTQKQSMMYTTGENERQGMTEAEMLSSQLVQPNMRKFGMGLAVVAAVYMLFGRSK